MDFAQAASLYEKGLEVKKQQETSSKEVETTNQRNQSQMNKKWKLLHKPTGLFYGPQRKRRGIITNLSEEGATYEREPTMNERPWFRDCFGKKVFGSDREWKAIRFIEKGK